MIFAVATAVVGAVASAVAIQQRYKTFTGRVDVSNETNSLVVAVLLFLHSR